MIGHPPTRQAQAAPAKKKARKSKGPSPTARAMKFYRDLGFTIEKVEQRLHGCFITRDLFNVIDLVAMKPGVGIVGVQATSNNGGNHSARLKKALAEPLLRLWMQCGGRFEVISFAQQCSDGRGSRKVWTARREAVSVFQLTSDVNGGGK